MQSSGAGKWVCRVHGDNVSVISFNADGKSHNYCFNCFIKILNQVVNQAVFVPNQVVSPEIAAEIKEGTISSRLQSKQ